MNYFVEGLQGAGKSTLVGKLSEKFPQHQVFREGDYNPVELAWCSYLTKEQYEAALGRYETLAAEMKEKTTFEPADKIQAMAGGAYEAQTGAMAAAGGAYEAQSEALSGAGSTVDRYVLTYTRILTDIPGFHKDLEDYEIYNGRIPREEFEQIILSRYARWHGEDQIFECSILQNIVENQILFYEMTDDEIVEFYKRLADVIRDRDFKILYLEVAWVAGALEIIRRERVDADGNEMWFPLMIGFLENCPHGKHHGLKGFDGLVKHLEHRKNLELRILREAFPEHAVILKSKEYNLETMQL
ncbi:MAG: hypothetical protein J6Q02_13175 [Lachnospiraceae bacterium]|nr:hypothetical protein [Lachnospiraceae bacterium]